MSTEQVPILGPSEASDLEEHLTRMSQSTKVAPIVAAYWSVICASLRAIVRGTATVIATAELEALRRDAERYRWLRDQHWSDNVMAVVMQPADSVKLGRSCPSLALLDEAIDTVKMYEKPR